MALTKVTGQVIKSDTNVTVGVITATKFVGPIETTGDVSAVDGTFTGSVSIAGTLTYADVTNVDSLGIVTARHGFRATAGGINVTAGISTFGGNIDANGTLDVDGDTQLDDLNVAGVATFSAAIDANGALDVDGQTDLDVLNVAEIATFAADVSIADSIIHTGDTNTKIRFPTADTITAETAGAERLRITSAGRLGINETSPDRDLHISNTTPYIRVESTSANQPATLELYHTRGNGSDKWPVSVATDDAALTFNVAGAANGSPAERLRITSDGRLLIGTATTKSAGSGQYAKLNVEGYAGGSECFMSLSRAEAASAMSANDEVANLTFNDSAGYEFARIQVLADAATGATDTPGRIVFKTTADGASSATERFRITSDGKYYFPGTGGGSGSRGLEIDTESVGAADEGVILNARASGTTGRIKFQTNSATAMTILGNGGNIGIGQDTPTSILHVTGASSPTILNKPNDASPAYFVGDSNRTGAGQHLAEFKGRWNGNDVARIVFLAGADTSNKDDGDIRIDTTTSGGSSTERLRITSAGKIEVKGTRSGALQANDDDTLKLYTKSTDNSINRGSGITFYNHDNSGYEMGGTIQVAKENGTADDAKAYMRFSTQSGSTTTERLRIDSSGRLLKSGEAALTSTSLAHPLQVAASNVADAIAIFGRASDDIGELSFYEADKSTKLGELQYRRDHLNFRHRVGSIRFCAAGSTEYMRLTTVTANSVTSGVLGINDTSPEGEALGLVVKSKNYQQTALPVVYIRRDNNAGGGDGHDEIALHVDMPYTYNGAGDCFGIKSYTVHNLNSTHYAGHFVARGSQYNAGGDGAGIYAQITKTDTNGGGYVPAGFFYGKHTYNASATGYAMGIRIKVQALTKNVGMQIHHENTNSDWTTMVRFCKGSSETEVGTIKSSNNATQYNTSSDYRLKENVVDLTGAITRLKQLKPKRFNFKNDTSKTVDGFIAHEVEPVVPQAVSGTKDATKIEIVTNPSTGKNVLNEDGTPKIETAIDPQEVDYSKLSTLTIAALQEALAKIETLETKVAALETA